MKFLLVCLLACLTAYVHAFALSGAYERMAFYDAYLMERLLKGKNANKIAAGCATGETDGTFTEFITFINKDGDKIPTAALDALPYERTPDVDTTAKILDDQNLGGNDVFDTVDQGSTSPDNLFRHVARFVNGNLPAIESNGLADLLKGVDTG